MPNPTVKPTSVYRYYDRAGILIYVGITARSTRRNVEHNKTQSWWPHVDRQEIDHLPSREEALRREAHLIERFRPPFNQQGNPDYKSVHAAYQAMYDGGLLDVDPKALLKKVRLLPLDVQSSGPGFAEFRTRLLYASITSRITVPHRNGVSIYYRSGKVGALSDVVKCGPMLRLLAPHIRKSVVVGRAEAKVIQVPLKKQLAFEIKRVFVYDE